MVMAIGGWCNLEGLASLKAIVSLYFNLMLVIIEIKGNVDLDLITY